MQLTGCSYLVLQSRHVFWGLTSFSNAALVFDKCFPYDASFSGCSYLVLQPSYIYNSWLWGLLHIPTYEGYTFTTHIHLWPHLVPPCVPSLAPQPPAPTHQDQWPSLPQLARNPWRPHGPRRGYLTAQSAGCCRRKSPTNSHEVKRCSADLGVPFLF